MLTSGVNEEIARFGNQDEEQAEDEDDEEEIEGFSTGKNEEEDDLFGFGKSYFLCFIYCQGSS